MKGNSTGVSDRKQQFKNVYRASDDPVAEINNKAKKGRMMCLHVFSPVWLNKERGGELLHASIRNPLSEKNSGRLKFGVQKLFCPEKNNMPSGQNL